jgi:hypothetical protein
MTSSQRRAWRRKGEPYTREYKVNAAQRGTNSGKKRQQIPKHNLLFFKKESITPMQTVTKTGAKTSRTAESEPTNLLKRIGSVTYVAAVRFSEKSAETFEDKVLRIIGRETNA